MNEKNEQKVDSVRNYLMDNDIFFLESTNGQFQVDNVNFWATTGTWYDAKKNQKGKGLNSFLKYLNLK